MTQPLICSSLVSNVDFVKGSTSLSWFPDNWSIPVSAGGVSGDWLVIWVLGMALAPSSAVEAELADTVDSLMLGLGSPSGSSSGAKKSRSA